MCGHKEQGPQSAQAPTFIHSLSHRHEFILTEMLSQKREGITILTQIGKSLTSADLLAGHGFKIFGQRRLLT